MASYILALAAVYPTVLGASEIGTAGGATWLEIVAGTRSERRPLFPGPGEDLWCKDEQKNCSKLGTALWELSGVCRYPAEERCLRTCGACWRVAAAEKCQCAERSCGQFCNTKVDWRAFFQRMVSHPDFPSGRWVSDRGFFMAEFPGFLSAAEADHLVALAERLGFEPEDSLPPDVRDVGKIDCEDPMCLFDPFVGEVYRRVSDLLGVPRHNFESLEFLKYGPGQHYKPHPDSGDDDWREPNQVGAGLRVMTVFFYLSDVEEGGETRFPKVKLKVRPEKGKIVVWANAQEDFFKTTKKAIHQSVPVKRGLKVAANFWVHPFDFRASENYAPETC